MMKTTASFFVLALVVFSSCNYVSDSADSVASSYGTIYDSATDAYESIGTADVQDVAEHPELYEGKNITVRGEASFNYDMANWCTGTGWLLNIVNNDGYKVSVCRNEKTKRVFTVGEQYTVSGTFVNHDGEWVLLET